MARDSIEHSFLRDATLSSALEKFVRAPACARVTPEESALSGDCARFLEGSEKARVQWRLEEAFSRFEKNF